MTTREAALSVRDSVENPPAQWMTLRDYFAAAVLTGHAQGDFQDLIKHTDAFARLAYDISDAMVRAREEA